MAGSGIPDGAAIERFALRIFRRFAGVLKSISDPFSYAHLSMDLEINSLPLSVLMTRPRPYNIVTPQAFPNIDRQTLSGFFADQA